MPKKLYVGVDHVARKCKKMYVGALTDVPVYGEGLETVGINTGNISDYFEVTDGAYKFAGSGSVFTSNNYHIKNTTASTVLTAKQDISALSFDYSYSSEKNYDKFTLKVGGTVVENAVSGATTSKSYSGSLTKGGTIEFTYSKDSSTDSNDDKCTFSNMSIQVIGRTQIGTEQKSLARKVAKGYIGVGGVARPFFGGGEVVYFGTATALENVDYYKGAATTVGDYALILNAKSKKHNAFNSNLVKTNVQSDQNYTGRHFAATTVGNYALFGGAEDGDNNATKDLFIFSNVLTYNDTLTLYAARYNASATTVGDYAIFAGGTDTVEAFDSALARYTEIEYLSSSRREMGATTIGNYALFAGGTFYAGSGGQLSRTEVDVYDYNLTHTTITSLTVGRRALAATTIKNYGLFAGGYLEGTGSKTTVDIYDESLVRLTPADLSVARSNLSATSIGEFALFGGGTTGSNETSIKYNTVDVFDTSLTRVGVLSLSSNRSRPAATTIANYALFAGGASGETAVDVYTVV